MLEAEFDGLTTKYRPTLIKKFRQANYIPQFDGLADIAKGVDISQGICRALAAAFIVRSWSKDLDDAQVLQEYHRTVDASLYPRIADFAASKAKTGFYAPAVSGKFTAGFSDTRAPTREDVGRFNVVALLQKQSYGNDPVADAKHAVAKLSNGTMPFAEQVVCCPGKIMKGAKAANQEELAFGLTLEEAIGKEMATAPKTPGGYLTRTGFWLISLNGHMVAAVVKPRVPKFRFFDPNNGIVQWNAPEPFDKFMNAFTGRDRHGGLIPTKWLRFG